MERMKISVLPHIVNACIMTSVLSSGNGDLYAVSRAIFGMSLDGKAPKFLSKTSKNGIPFYCVLVGLCFCFLAFLKASASNAIVITWLVSLVTACQMVNYLATAITYRHFYAALQAQGIDRNTLPYKGRFQPYTSYIAMGGSIFGMLANGWTDFLTASPFNVRNFFLSYTFVGVFPILFIFWKVVKKTKYIKPGTADLSLGGIREEIDHYEATFVSDNKGKISSWIDEKVF